MYVSYITQGQNSFVDINCLWVCVSMCKEDHFIWTICVRKCLFIYVCVCVHIYQMLADCIYSSCPPPPSPVSQSIKSKAWCEWWNITIIAKKPFCCWIVFIRCFVAQHTHTHQTYTKWLTNRKKTVNNNIKQIKTT